MHEATNSQERDDSLESRLFSPSLNALRYPGANLSDSRRRKADLFTVDRSTVVTQSGIEKWPYPGKTTRWPISARAHEGLRGEDCHGEYASGTYSPAKRKKERGGNELWRVHPIRSRILHRMTAEKENMVTGRGKEGERERETYWPRQAVSGLPILRALLVDPYEANYTSPKAPHLHPRPTFPGRVLFSLVAVIGSAARTSYIRYRCKSIYLVRYSANNSCVILVCVIWVIVFSNCSNPQFELRVHSC